MAIDNPRIRARHELEELGISPESAAFLVDDRPPGGWESLVTTDELRAAIAEVRAEMAELRGELRTELQRELRAQTWRLGGAVFVAFGLFATVTRI